MEDQEIYHKLLGAPAMCIVQIHSKQRKQVQIRLHDCYLLLLRYISIYFTLYPCKRLNSSINLCTVTFGGHFEFLVANILKYQQYIHM